MHCWLSLSIGRLVLSAPVKDRKPLVPELPEADSSLRHQAEIACGELAQKSKNDDAGLLEVS